MSSHGKSSYSGKTQSAGVSLYNHVSRKFMIPYGIKKRDDYFEEKELLGVMQICHARIVSYSNAS